MSLQPVPAGRLALRETRAIALIALAVAVVAAAGFAFLQSTSGKIPEASQQATFDRIIYYFATPAVGWAVENPTPGGRFAVFVTTDGARHWTKQLVLPSSVVSFDEAATQFIDARHAYIAAGDPFQRLYRTSDGGRSWISTALPPGSARVVKIAFSDEASGWLLVEGRTSAFYATRNSGETWDRLPDPPADADGLVLRGPTEAWTGSAAAGTPHVYLSTDAGKTWQRIDLPAPFGRSPEVSVPAGVELLPDSGVRVFLPPTDQPVAVKLGLSLTLVSLDQGATWRYVPPPPGTVAYQDALNWWAMSETSLFKSSDSGQTWTAITHALSDMQYVPHVIDSKHAWAVTTTVAGASGLVLTDDGGLHWRRANVPALAEA
jgi:photosystem II stability/assembly factor-like uncharacterized protein